MSVHESFFIFILKCNNFALNVTGKIVKNLKLSLQLKIVFFFCAQSIMKPGLITTDLTTELSYHII
jgi:hypothetical protein